MVAEINPRTERESAVSRFAFRVSHFAFRVSRTHLCDIGLKRALYNR